MAPVKKPKPFLGKHYLQEWRELKGIGQQEAATAINLSRTMLSKIENGENPYQQQYVEGLARFYKCSPSELIGKDPNTEPQDAETKIRSALLAYGVHRDLLDSAMLAIVGFRSDSADDEPPRLGHAPADTGPASRRRAKAPS